MIYERPMSTAQEPAVVSRDVDLDFENEIAVGRRKLRKSGSSIVLTIPRGILDAVDFEVDDQIELEADFQGDEIRLRKASAPDIDSE